MINRVTTVPYVLGIAMRLSCPEVSVTNGVNAISYGGTNSCDARIQS